VYEYGAALERIVDGDTLDLIIDVGFKMTTNQRIRLANIDTPETFRVSRTSEEYKSGIEARQYVEKRLADNQNKMRIKTYKNVGKYGRYLGEIWLADSEISLNDELLQKGFAKKFEG
jgi:micrococcal nuclease